MVFIRQSRLLVLGLCAIVTICEATPHNDASLFRGGSTGSPSYEDPRNARPYGRGAGSGIMGEEYNNPADGRNSIPNLNREYDHNPYKVYSRDQHDHKEHHGWHDHKGHGHDWHNPKEHVHKHVHIHEHSHK